MTQRIQLTKYEIRFHYVGETATHGEIITAMNEDHALADFGFTYNVAGDRQEVVISVKAVM